MNTVALVCPNCGAVLHGNGSRNEYKCDYCGSLIRVENISPSATEGIPTEESLLRRAFILLSDGKFRDADGLLSRVLELNPDCSKAYIGRVMIGWRVKTMPELRDLPTNFAQDRDFDHAVEFAESEEIRNYYLSLKEDAHEQFEKKQIELIGEAEKQREKDRLDYKHLIIDAAIGVVSLIIGLLILSYGFTHSAARLVYVLWMPFMAFGLWLLGDALQGKLHFFK